MVPEIFRALRKGVRMIDVKGKWCFVTGGCRGVGRLIAIEMAKLGANLILQGRDKSHAEKVIAELAPYGVQVKAVGCNLENESEIEAALAEIDSFGVQVDLVFNNAGLMSHYFCRLLDQYHGRFPPGDGRELLCADKDRLPLFAGDDQARFWPYAAYDERYRQ